MTELRNGSKGEAEISDFVGRLRVIPDKKRPLIDVDGIQRSEESLEKCFIRSVAKKPFPRLEETGKAKNILRAADLKHQRYAPNLPLFASEHQLNKRQTLSFIGKDSIPLLSPISDKTNDSAFRQEGKVESYLDALESPGISSIGDISSLCGISLYSGGTQGSIPEGVIDIDSMDAGDHLSEHKFAAEIQRNMLQREKKFLVDFTYMVRQVEVTEKMRTILVDWLVDVHRKFDLHQETLHLTVNIIDRFLENNTVSRKKLQLVGVAATLISSKYEEIYAPVTSDYVYITDRAYCEEEILRMESIILGQLQFDLIVPSSLRFLRRNLKALRALCGDRINLVGHLAHYCVDLCLQDVGMLRYRPSERAAAAVLLATKLLCRDLQWDRTMTHYSGKWDAESLGDCELSMLGLLRSEQDPEKINKLTAIKRKFSSKRYEGISQLEINMNTDILL